MYGCRCLPIMQWTRPCHHVLHLCAESFLWFGCTRCDVCHVVSRLVDFQSWCQGDWLRRAHPKNQIHAPWRRIRFFICRFIASARQMDLIGLLCCRQWSTRCSSTPVLFMRRTGVNLRLRSRSQEFVDGCAADFNFCHRRMKFWRWIKSVEVG